MRNQFSGARISWHPAFVQAIRLELEQYGDKLEFIPEAQLTAEPLKIDVVVIKKARDLVIEKNIAVIFREYNILEYKNPTDHVSIGDFYKVYAYACLYASLEEVPITAITLTFVESRRPRNLLAHLKKVRGYTVEEGLPGIYTVTGDILPIQIINSRRLSEEENIWLKDLDIGLDVERINRITTEIGRLGKAVQVGAYAQTAGGGAVQPTSIRSRSKGPHADVISRANVVKIREAAKMSKSKLTLEQVFEEVGWIAKWEEKGRVQGASQLFELIKSGKTPDEAMRILGLEAARKQG
jgi:hypothetical protein